MLRGAMEPFRQLPLSVARGSTHRAASSQPESSAVSAPSQSVSTPSCLDSGRDDKGDVGRGKLGGAMGLKQFMHRKRVLDLYRAILKVRRTLDGDRRGLFLACTQGQT